MWVRKGWRDASRKAAAECGIAPRARRRLGHSFSLNIVRRWGYRDTEFFVNPRGDVELSGTRYAHVFEAGRIFPKLREWIEEHVGLDLECVLREVKSRSMSE